MSALKNRDYRHALIPGSVILLFAFTFRLFSAYIGYFGVNTMDCIKGRYFFIDRLDKHPKDGDYFAFYFKGSDLYPRGMEFIKIVACSQGENLATKHTPKGTAYFCENRLLGYACDRRKNPGCPQYMVFNGKIPQGCYFAMGTAYRAYDSRYYGLVCHGIIGRAFKFF